MKRSRSFSFVLVLPLGIVIIWNTLSVSLIENHASIAKAIRPSSELVLAEEARLSFPTVGAGKPVFDPARLARTEEYAQRAVEAAPYAPQAVGMLAFVSVLRGEDARAELIVASSSAIARRDKLLYISKVMVAAQQSDPQRIVYNLESLSRIQKSPDQTLFPLLLQLLRNDDFFPSMVGLFERRPLWRTRFFVLAAQNRGNAASLARLIDALSDRGVRLGAEELATFFIVNRQNLPAADQLRRWNRYFAAGENVSNTVIRDAKFTSISGPPPYSWTFGDGSNAKGWLDAKPGQANDKQVVIVSDATDKRLLLSQYLTASEGRWSFTIKGSIQGPQFQDIRISLHCLGSGAKIADAPFTLNRTSSSLRMSFTVPDGCPQQDLQIYSEKAAGAEAFEAHFDDADMKLAS